MVVEYVVRCVCESEDVRARVERWLLEQHLADVVTAGALEASLTRFDDAPLSIEARYRFADRHAFAVYERDQAPRLRVEGRALFPDGVRFERRTGALLGERGAVERT